MPEDNMLISSQTHELNYLLTKWEKKQNGKNRDILRNTLKDFRADESYKPHTRGIFYKYVEEHNILKLLEDAEKKKSLSRKRLMPDVEMNDLTVDDPYIHKTDKMKTKSLKGKKQKIQIQDLAAYKSQKPAGKLPGVMAEKAGAKEGVKKGSKKGLILILIIVLIVILLIAIFLAGTCVYQNSQAKKRDTSLQEVIPENIHENEGEGASDAGKESFTQDSLKSFLKTCTPIYFKSDLDEFIEGEDQKIQKLASYLKNFVRVELSIEGHTANTGRPENEMDLSIRRADHVARFLEEETQKAGLTVKTRGYGATMEAVKNPPGEKMKLNRRVEISVMKAESE